MMLRNRFSPRQRWLATRTAVSVADIQRVAKPALRHRILLNFEGEAEAVDVDHIVENVLAAVPTPSGEAE